MLCCLFFTFCLPLVTGSQIKWLFFQHAEPFTAEIIRKVRIKSTANFIDLISKKSQQNQHSCNKTAQLGSKAICNEDSYERTRFILRPSISCWWKKHIVRQNFCFEPVVCRNFETSPLTKCYGKLQLCIQYPTTDLSPHSWGTANAHSFSF